jgi:hypothetical protein
MSTIFAPAFFASSITLLGVAILVSVNLLVVCRVITVKTNAAPEVNFANNRRSVEVFLV